jgi:hypothetical protein
MQTELLDRYQRATPELSRELLEELESANDAVKLVERVEADASDAEERATQIDRNVSKRLAEVKDELQRAQTVALDAGIEGSASFADAASKYDALVAQIALLDHTRDRHRAYAMLDARRATLVAQSDLAKAQKRATHLEYDYVLNELLLVEEAKARINGAIALNEQSFSSGRAGQLRNQIVRLDDMVESLKKAIIKHDAEAEERRAAYRKERKVL